MSGITSPDGTPISRFAFGTMQFGGPADASTSAAMLEAAIGAGITHFDTAHLYTEGRSERLLGQLAASIRKRMIVATKIGYTPNTPPEKLRAEFELSRERLGMAVIDILYLHRPDAATPLPARLEVLIALKEAGHIRHIGLSNFPAWQVMQADCLLRAMGHRVDIIQPMYSLVKRQAEVELLPMCAATGLLAATYSPLGGGLLTGKYAQGGTGRLSENPRYAARYAPAFMHEAAAGLSAIAARLSCHPATLAAAWAAHHPAAPMPILSARSVEQLAPALAAIGFTMDADLYAEITALTPTPPPATDRIEEQ
ncbi:aldo/keto reductase [Aquicoccus sp. G2-2]|uniref:aldo/keto reductase n=1 Tax=Aquicoccus sp. G2-2 TaxID=3092120 RepID=UPI002ADF03AA|nr:aldo/keto reductase [Aquicoccus sp. G2-2]MEA1113890.1 aldo/keto reductase [Aquicoccus sp. G2-2]